MLSSYNTLTGDPGFMTKDIQRYLDVTADTVNTTVQKYLGTNRVVLHVNAPKAEE